MPCHCAAPSPIVLTAVGILTRIVDLYERETRGRRVMVDAPPFVDHDVCLARAALRELTMRDAMTRGDDRPWNYCRMCDQPILRHHLAGAAPAARR